jgi:hypothetical protein
MLGQCVDLHFYLEFLYTLTHHSHVLLSQYFKCVCFFCDITNFNVFVSVLLDPCETMSEHENNELDITTE